MDVFSSAWLWGCGFSTYTANVASLEHSVRTIYSEIGSKAYMRLVRRQGEKYTLLQANHFIIKIIA